MRRPDEIYVAQPLYRDFSPNAPDKGYGLYRFVRSSNSDALVRFGKQAEYVHPFAEPDKKDVLGWWQFRRLEPPVLIADSYEELKLKADVCGYDMADRTYGSWKYGDPHLILENDLIFDGNDKFGRGLKHRLGNAI